MSVNISGKQLQQLSLVDQIKDTLRKTQLDPECLHLEITETVIMENAQGATEMLGQLKALGVKLSIDDFGTGYSSLSYLHRFPFDILKIDRSFVTQMGPDNESTGIIETILILADKLGKQAIAEGVETPDQMLQLAAAGCGFGQGYLFSRPVAADAARLLLTQGAAQEPPPNPSAIPSRKEVEVVTDIYAM